jgi:hypothetical protein
MVGARVPASNGPNHLAPPTRLAPRRRKSNSSVRCHRPHRFQSSATVNNFGFSTKNEYPAEEFWIGRGRHHKGNPTTAIAMRRALHVSSAWKLAAQNMVRNNHGRTSATSDECPEERVCRGSRSSSLKSETLRLPPPHKRTQPPLSPCVAPRPSHPRNSLRRKTRLATTTDEPVPPGKVL